MHSYEEESSDVQLAVMTAVVKIFLTNPQLPETKTMCETILSQSINNVSDHDIRDRAFFYLNIINKLGPKAINVISAQEQTISVARNIVPPALIETLIPLLGSVANIYMIFPSEFEPPLIISDEQSAPPSLSHDDNINFDLSKIPMPSENQSYPLIAESSQQTYMCDIFGGFNIDKENGLKGIDFRISNHASTPLEIKQILMKGNVFGLTLKNEQSYPAIEPNNSRDIHVLLEIKPEQAIPENTEFTFSIINNHPGNIIFGIPLTLSSILLPDNFGHLSKNEITDMIHQIPESQIQSITISSVIKSTNDAKELLRNQHLVLFGDQNEKIIFSGRFINNEKVVIRIQCLSDSCCIETFCGNPAIGKIVLELINQIISKNT